MNERATYRTSVDVGAVRLRDLTEIIDSINTTGYAEFDGRHTLTITYDIGGHPGENAAGDLWDLRDIVAEHEAILTSFIPGPVTIEKPQRVTS